MHSSLASFFLWVNFKMKYVTYVWQRGAGTSPVTSSRIRDSVCSSVSSIFTVISSVFQVFPAVSKVRRVDSCSRRKKIREMKEEKEEIKRNGGGGKTGKQYLA